MLRTHLDWRASELSSPLSVPFMRAGCADATVCMRCSDRSATGRWGDSAAAGPATRAGSSANCWDASADGGPQEMGRLNPGGRPLTDTPLLRAPDAASFDRSTEAVAAAAAGALDAELYAREMR